MLTATTSGHGTLLGQARQFDPRMPALWDGNLPAPAPPGPPAATAR